MTTGKQNDDSTTAERTSTTPQEDSRIAFTGADAATTQRTAPVRLPFVPDIELFHLKVEAANQACQGVAEALNDDYLWHTYSSSWDDPCNPDEDTLAQIASSITDHAIARDPAFNFYFQGKDTATPHPSFNIDGLEEDVVEPSDEDQ